MAILGIKLSENSNFYKKTFGKAAGFVGKRLGHGEFRRETIGKNGDFCRWKNGDFRHEIVRKSIGKTAVLTGKRLGKWQISPENGMLQHMEMKTAIYYFNFRLLFQQ